MKKGISYIILCFFVLENTLFHFQDRMGIVVEDGNEAYREVVHNWADMVLCTGSTLANGSIVNFLDIGKPVVFFGTTIAGAAVLLDLERACFYPA